MTWVAGGLLLLGAVLIGLGIVQVNKGIANQPRGVTEAKKSLPEVIFAYFKQMVRIIMDSDEPSWRKQIAWGVALISLGLIVLLAALVPLGMTLAGGDGTPSDGSTSTGGP